MTGNPPRFDWDDGPRKLKASEAEVASEARRLDLLYGQK
jgi:hypothetical protein